MPDLKVSEKDVLARYKRLVVKELPTKDKGTATVRFRYLQAKRYKLLFIGQGICTY